MKQYKSAKDICDEVYEKVIETGITLSDFGHEMNEILLKEERRDITKSRTVVLGRWLNTEGKQWSEPGYNTVEAMKIWLNNNK